MQMSAINIQLPAVEGEHNIEIDVKINGEKRTMHYRVEILSWEDCTETEGKAICLRRKLQEYPEDWKLIHIGSPTENSIPLMFKQQKN